MLAACEKSRVLDLGPIYAERAKDKIYSESWREFPKFAEAIGAPRAAKFY
jgi:hypothetical protein